MQKKAGKQKYKKEPTAYNYKLSALFRERVINEKVFISKKSYWLLIGIVYHHIVKKVCS